MTWGQGWVAFIVSTRNSSFLAKCFLTIYTAQFRKILAGGWRGISHTAGTASLSPFTDWCLPAYSLPGAESSGWTAKPYGISPMPVGQGREKLL